MQLEAIAFLLIGILFLYMGAEFLVRGSVSLALRLRVPTLVVGLVIAGYGTGTPELVVSANASIQGHGELAIANAIGSNICNIGLILAVSALIKPLMVKERLVKVEIPAMMAITVGVVALLYDGGLSRGKSLLCIVALVIYTIWVVAAGRKAPLADDGDEPRLTSLLKESLFVAGGIVALWFGGELFLSGAITLAQGWGVGDAAIGLTVVALGTSLPELATSLVAVARNQRDIAIGNVVGSNVFNLLAITGVSGLIAPTLLSHITKIDYLVLLAYSGSLLILARSALNRWEGGLLISAYVVYFIFTLHGIYTNSLHYNC